MSEPVIKFDCCMCKEILELPLSELPEGEEAFYEDCPECEKALKILPLRLNGSILIQTYPRE